MIEARMLYEDVGEPQYELRAMLSRIPRSQIADQGLPEPKDRRASYMRVGQPFSVLSSSILFLFARDITPIHADMCHVYSI